VIAFPGSSNREVRPYAKEDSFGGTAATSGFQRVSSGTRGRKAIKELEGLPGGELGFEVSGKILAEDYRDVVIPAIARAGRTGDVRALLVIPEFAGMSGGALWQDLKVGVEHLWSVKRVALVTDIDWVTHATHLFGWMTPGEIRTFPLNQLDNAKTWVSG
jgi:stage II sporulation SpoAA-like protein